MTLAEVKNFLKLDFDDDDALITLILQAAQEYIRGAVGKYDEGSARMRLLLLNIVTTLYENRLYTVAQANEKVQYSLRSMVLQLQLEGEDESGEI